MRREESTLMFRVGRRGFKKGRVTPHAKRSEML